MATADLITQLKQDFDDVYAAGKAAGGGGGPSGYWERWVEAGPQTGPDTFDWPTEKKPLKNVSSVHASPYGSMPDGSPVHYVMNGYDIEAVSFFAYKETYKG
jgi:hypothetical protein